MDAPDHPTRTDAEAALLTLRKAFRTFPFADSPRVIDEDHKVDVVDIVNPPGFDESAALAGLLTAACRPSLCVAPGILCRAPSISGSGVGKGLLLQAMSLIAYGQRARAFTYGGDRAELDKRLSAALLDGPPAVFLDNVNGVALRSDTLASVLTERTVLIRILGRSEMVRLNSAALILVTGNGLSVSEDLARRFVLVELDAHMEDPERRPFPPGFLDVILCRRAELLTALLTTWRWGRQNRGQIAHGRPLGNFERWCEWVRDPLLALGCRDVVERIESAKAADPHRREVTELFAAWWDEHQDRPVTAAALAEPVRAIADPQHKGRQFLARYLQKLDGTQLAHFRLTGQKAAGKWNATTYRLEKTSR